MLSLRITNPPQKGYLFGNKDSPVTLSLQPAQAVEALIQWQSQAGYVAYSDVTRALYGLTRRGLALLKSYEEKLALPTEANAGYTVMPNTSQEGGDVLVLWAPAYKEPEQEEKRVTGVLRLALYSEMDFQRLMDAFIQEDPTGDILNLFMDNGDQRGYPPTLEEKGKIQKILQKAQK